MQKVIGKTFRILGLDGWKGRWVLEQDVHWNCWVKVAWFLPFSATPLTESYSFWYGLKNLFTLHKFVTELSLTTDDITRDRRDMHGSSHVIMPVQGQMG